MTGNIFSLATGIIISMALAGPLHAADAVPPAPNGIELPAGYKDWRVIGSSHREDNKTLRVILGNDAAIAAARVINPDYRIPLAVVTNGSDAELLDTTTGKILGYGLDSIPDSDTADEMVEHLQFLPPLDAEKRERELRILNAFDVERCCF